MRGDFFDTNILVYAASKDDVKFERAEALLSGGGVISVQVLNEFTHVARRKMSLPWPRIRYFLDGVRALVDVRPVEVVTHDRAVDLAERHGFHIYDALIVAAALTSGCSMLMSEDMHDGMVIDGRLQVLNPFRSD